LYFSYISHAHRFLEKKEQERARDFLAIAAAKPSIEEAPCDVWQVQHILHLEGRGFIKMVGG